MKKSLFAAMLLFAAGFAVSAGDDSKDAFAAAKNAAKEKNWTQVVSICEGVYMNSEDAKQKIAALNAMADAYLKMDKKEEAVNKLVQIASVQGVAESDMVAASDKVIKIRLNQKEYKSAALICQQVVEKSKDPKAVCRANLTLAELSLKDKKNDDALAALTKAQSMKDIPAKEQMDLMVRSAALYGKLGKTAEEQQTLQKALELSKGKPAFAEVATRLADCNLKQKKFAEAEDLYKQAISAIEKDFAEKAAKAAEKAKKNAEKGKPAKESAAKGGSGRLIDAHKKLAKAYSSENKVDEAVAEYDAILKIENLTDKQRFSAASDKIGTLAHAKKFKEANELIVGLIPQVNDPDEKIRLYNRQAEFFFEQKDYPNALNALNQASGVQGAQKAKPNDRLKNRIEKAMAPAPEPKAKKAPKGAPQGAPKGEPKGAPQGAPKGEPKGAPDGAPKGEPKGAPQGAPKGEPKGAPDGAPQDK